MKENINIGSVRFNTTVGLSEFFPFIYFLVFLLLVIIVFRVGFSKISEQKRTIENLEKNESLLIEKKNKLEKISTGIVPIYSDLMAFSLPVESSILTNLLTIKRLLSENFLPVESYQVSLASPEVSDSSQVSGDLLRLELIGEREQIFLFLRKVENILPLANLGKLHLSQDGDLLSADLDINFFWSPYNDKKSGSVLQDLNEEEKRTFEVLSNMEKPEINVPLSPEGPYTTRTNPFLE